MKGHSDEVNSIDFHCSQQVMCTASDDSKCIIWDFQEGIVLRGPPGGSHGEHAVLQSVGHHR